jgi:hypothetical protein
MKTLELTAFVNLFEQLSTETQFKALDLLHKSIDDRDLPKEYYYFIDTGYFDKFLRSSRRSKLEAVVQDYESENEQTLNIKFIAYQTYGDIESAGFIEFGRDDEMVTQKLADLKSIQLYDYIAKKQDNDEFIVMQSDEPWPIEDLIRLLRDVQYCGIFDSTAIEKYDTFIDDTHQIITYMSLDSEHG